MAFSFRGNTVHHDMEGPGSRSMRSTWQSESRVINSSPYKKQRDRDRERDRDRQRQREAEKQRQRGTQRETKR